MEIVKAVAFSSTSKSIDTLVLRILDQLYPEIIAKKLKLDLDLDHVCVPQLTSDINAAVLGILVNAIHSADHHADISITLINSAGLGTPGHWELEICDFSDRDESRVSSREIRRDFNNQVLSVVDEPGDSSHANRFSIGNFDLAVKAAERCNGSIEAWHCPQGGIALILVMPLRKGKHAA